MRLYLELPWPFTRRAAVFSITTLVMAISGCAERGEHETNRSEMPRPGEANSKQHRRDAHDLLAKFKVLTVINELAPNSTLELLVRFPQGPAVVRRPPDGEVFLVFYAARVGTVYRAADAHQYKAILEDGREMEPLGRRVEEEFFPADENVGILGPVGPPFTIFPHMTTYSESPGGLCLTLVFLIPANSKSVDVFQMKSEVGDKERATWKKVAKYEVSAKTSPQQEGH